MENKQEQEETVEIDCTFLHGFSALSQKMEEENIDEKTKELMSNVDISALDDEQKREILEILSSSFSFKEEQK